jgi:phosphoribosylformimino-5-aminoimidazole carboxamide ribotide isomerase
MKVIPAIDLMGGEVVRLFKGDPAQKTVYSDDPISIAKKWEADGADMLHVVDLDATLSLGDNREIIKKIVNSVSIPVEVAGGLRSESLILEMAAIANRVVIGTLAFKEPELLQKILSILGHKKIVISVDHKDGYIVTHGWTSLLDVSLIDCMREFLAVGFTEFLLTNVNKDGTLEGPDLEYLKSACELNHANVISSGGISGVYDIIPVKEKNAWGVILGKALYDGKINISESIELS